MISGAGRPCEADDDQHAAGTNQLLHATQSVSGIDVVEHGTRGHEVERCELERVREQVAAHELGLTICPRVFRGSIDARSVDVDTDDIHPASSQIEGQKAITTPDIERLRMTGRSDIEDQTMVMDVEVPPITRRLHRRSIAPR